MAHQYADTSDEVLRPHRHLFARGMGAVVIATVPMFGVLYWATAASGDWPKVLVIQALALTLAFVAMLGYRRASISLGPGWVRERGFLGGLTIVRREDVRQILLLDVYQTSTLETKPQLFVSSHEGRLLLRLRGEFWSVDDMERIAGSLDVPITERSHAATISELRRSSPELLYWFERFPRVRRSSSA